MANEPLLIIKRFVLSPATHLLTDTALKTEARLEPRIVEVLLHLLKAPGQVVTREELVAEVWKDYGGGDEGLTQAISSLRRLLCDEQRAVIQTIPKKGYVFRGVVEPFNTLPPPPPARQSKMNRRLGAVIGCALLVSGTVYLWKAPPATPKAAFRTGTVLPSGDFERQEENEDNTIVAVDKENAHYKLVMIGDRPPKFYINGRLIPVDQWEPHQELINSLKWQLQEKSRK